MTDMYPKYRVVRKYDEYWVEVKTSPTSDCGPAKEIIAGIGYAGCVAVKRSKEKDAVSKAESLRDEAILEYKRKTDIEVVWGPEP